MDHDAAVVVIDVVEDLAECRCLLSDVENEEQGVDQDLFASRPSPAGYLVEIDVVCIEVVDACCFWDVRES